jgi:UDP-glucose 4-epimerase
MNILITGAAGYVGSVCAAELIRQGHQAIGYDNLLTGHRAALPPEIDFVQADVADREALDHTCRKYRIDAVMHFAASALIDESIRNPGLFYRNNVSATITLLDALVQNGIRNLVFSSSAAVYGEPKKVPIDESHPTAPMNPYGETKLVIEKALEWYHRAHGINCVALRYFSAAGATEELGENHVPETHLLPRLLDAALKPGKTFEIYGNDYPTADGTCVRDFVHVRDIAQAHILALGALPSVRFGIYNVGHGQGYSIKEVIRTVEEVTGRKLSVRLAGRRPGDPAVLVASHAKLGKELKWEPQYSDLKSVVRSAWAWKQTHPQGYDGAMEA